ncbi:MAG: prolyl oligopeptidase family serine peptidase [Candidatus Omnitrophota bacterium]
MNKKKESYINWQPVLTPEDVFSDAVGIGEVCVDLDNTYWLEMRPAEKGRYVVVQRNSFGTIKDITPADCNVRTRVHEYGGGSYAVFNDVVYFVNFSDQRIYCQSVHGKQIYALTPEKNQDGSMGKYASLTVSPDGKMLVFVYEKEWEQKENENFLGMLCLGTEEISEPLIIAKGCDFYADPVISRDSRRIAWLAWNHPDMPWDSTELIVADINQEGLSNIQKVAGGKQCSVCLPRFDKNNDLYFIMDKVAADAASWDNWWNIYRFNDQVEQITFEQAEFGEPHWVFGTSLYDFLPDGTLISKLVKDGVDKLVIVDPKKKTISLVHEEFSSYGSITTTKNGAVLFVAAGTRKSPALYCFDVLSRMIEEFKKCSHLIISEEDISEPQLISYTTQDGEVSHAYLYMPKNSNYSIPENEGPPLLVIAHGGPTSRTKGHFSLVTQYWTTAGFAVVDVNYRGSTGYGRKYRDKLLGTWGVADAEDVADCVRYLIKEGKVDGNKVAVRGGSAGGYMVQRVMTQFPELFGVGASYYGIGNLITLVIETHKFESRYIDNLVGTTIKDGEEIYKDRSPINHLDKLKSPMIIFQGTDDKIVTPECSREMARILQNRGIKFKYVEYAEEAHGFRKKENNVDSLTRERDFYLEVFRS